MKKQKFESHDSINSEAYLPITTVHELLLVLALSIILMTPRVAPTFQGVTLALAIDARPRTIAMHVPLPSDSRQDTHACTLSNMRQRLPIIKHNMQVHQISTDACQGLELVTRVQGL